MKKLAVNFPLPAYLALLAGAAYAQTFEVVSVKPADPNGRGTMIRIPNGTFSSTGITARNCITLAYDIQTFQLEGGASWIGTERYDIDAKMGGSIALAPSGPAHMDQMRAALQALLAERFQLAVHRESKMMPAYELVLAKSGFKLKTAPDDGHGANMSSNRGKFTAEKISMAMLARNLAGILSSPVVEMTGVAGVFDMTLEYAPDEVQSADKASGDPAEPSIGPSIFTALQEQLGLKLETKKAPLEMIVIDRIEKPTAN